MDQQLKTNWIKRAINWIHDSLIVLGVLVVFICFGGARMIGYYFDFSFVPIEIVQLSKNNK